MRKMKTTNKNTIIYSYLISFILLWGKICFSQITPPDPLLIPLPPVPSIYDNVYSDDSKEKIKWFTYENYQVCRLDMREKGNGISIVSTPIGDTIVVTDTSSRYTIKLKFVSLIVLNQNIKGVCLNIEFIDNLYNGLAEVNYDEDMFIVFIPKDPCVYENEFCASCSTPHDVDTMSLESFGYLSKKCVGYINFKQPNIGIFTRFLLMFEDGVVPSLKRLFSSDRSTIQMILLGYKDMDKEQQMEVFNISKHQSDMLYDQYLRARRFLSIYRE